MAKSVALTEVDHAIDAWLKNAPLSLNDVISWRVCRESGRDIPVIELKMYYQKLPESDRPEQEG